MLLVARVLRERDSDSACYTSLHPRLPTLCIFKLLCVSRRGADVHILVASLWWKEAIVPLHFHDVLVVLLVVASGF